jgi:hypothetical protein
MNKQQIFKHPSLRQKGKKNIEQEIFGRFHHRWALSISVGAPVNIFFRFRIYSSAQDLGQFSPKTWDSLWPNPELSFCHALPRRLAPHTSLVKRSRSTPLRASEVPPHSCSFVVSLLSSMARSGSPKEDVTGEAKKR